MERSVFLHVCEEEYQHVMLVDVIHVLYFCFSIGVSAEVIEKLLPIAPWTDVDFECLNEFPFDVFHVYNVMNSL